MYSFFTVGLPEIRSAPSKAAEGFRLFSSPKRRIFSKLRKKNPHNTSAKTHKRSGARITNNPRDECVPPPRRPLLSSERKISLRVRKTRLPYWKPFSEATDSHRCGRKKNNVKKTEEVLLTTHAHTQKRRGCRHSDVSLKMTRENYEMLESTQQSRFPNLTWSG